MTQANSNGFALLLDQASRKLNEGISVYKTMHAMAHQLLGLIETNKRVDLFDIYFYTSYFSEKVLKPYFVIRVRPKVIKALYDSSLEKSIKDSLKPELTELRESYFDADFIPKISMLREALTTFRNIGELYEGELSKKKTQEFATVLNEILITASKSTWEELQDDVKKLVMSSNSEDSYRKNIRELFTRYTKEVYEWE